MNNLLEIIGYFFIFIGTFFFIITGVAMVRFPDFYTRLHAGSKSLTGGGVSILIGIICFEGINRISLKLALIILFLIITNPVTSHAIARAAYYFGLKPKGLLRDDLEVRS